MSIRFSMLLAGTLGMALASSGRAAPPAAPEPSALPPALQGSQANVSANQRQANVIAAQLRQSGLLRGYAVDISVQGSYVALTGYVASQPQCEEVLRIVQGVPGVERVINRLRVGGQITRTEAGGEPGQLPAPLPASPAPPVAPPQGAVGHEPVPIFSAPMPAYHQLNPPPMPPYSWPTYAPYNNYSRVAYPEAYPYNSWPYIGPFHPYPKVPLGWRSVKLEWDDGHWWYSRTATKYDWWRLRFW